MKKNAATAYKETAIAVLRILCLHLPSSTIKDVFYRLDGSFTAAYEVLLQMDELEPILRPLKISAAFLPPKSLSKSEDDTPPLGYVVPKKLVEEIKAIGNGPFRRSYCQFLERLFPKLKKNCLETAVQLESKKREHVIQDGGIGEERSDPSDTIECQCCFENFASKSSRMVSCELGHMFCTDCLAQQAEDFALREEFVIPCFLPACGVEPCDAIFSDSDISHCIRHPTTRRRFFTAKANILSTKVWGESWKQEEKTEITRKVPKKTLEQRFEDELTAVVIRSCPGCASPLQKVGGCNHLICPKCKTHSCYVCRSRLVGTWAGLLKHYGGGKCESESSEVKDRQTRDEMALKLREQALAEGDTELADRIKDWLGMQDPPLTWWQVLDNTFTALLPLLTQLLLYTNMFLLLLGQLILMSNNNVHCCITDVDCAMNGECEKPSPHRDDAQFPGTCRCSPGWKGSTCEVLDLLPVDSRHQGLQLPDRNSSTWGGSVVFRDGMYHMFASEIINGCGLYSWTTNSQIIRAVSAHPFGPYERVDLILPTFAHLANVMEAPTGEIVLFGTMHPHPHPKDCRSHNETSGNMLFDTTPRPPKDSYMLWANSPEGPWSEPQLVLNSTIWNTDYWERHHHYAHCDSNLNGFIENDGSFIGLWRRCETNTLRTIPHTLYASDWKNASTYQPHTEPLFVLTGAGAEDPSNIWVTTSVKTQERAYHAIFHDEQSTRCMLGQCSANGRHAFSLDGKAWRYAAVDCYQRNVTWTNGTTMQVDTRARPHVVLDPVQRIPMALSTGLKETDESGYVWTLVQGMRGFDWSSDELITTTE